MLVERQERVAEQRSGLDQDVIDGLLLADFLETADGFLEQPDRLFRQARLQRHLRRRDVHLRMRAWLGPQRRDKLALGLKGLLGPRQSSQAAEQEAKCHLRGFLVAVLDGGIERRLQ